MKLIALRCPQCDTWLQPNPNDVVLLCPTCATAVSLNDQGVQAIPLNCGVPLADSLAWYPFWLFQGRIVIQSRQVQGGKRREAEAAQQFWQESRRLYVPAWELSVHDARELGAQLAHEQPRYQVGETPDKFAMHPATADIDDARKLLEFIVLTIEAQRSDLLRDLQFEVQVGEPQLWALPVQETSRGWQVSAMQG